MQVTLHSVSYKVNPSLIVFLRELRTIMYESASHSVWRLELRHVTEGGLEQPSFLWPTLKEAMLAHN